MTTPAIDGNLGTSKKVSNASILILLISFCLFFRLGSAPIYILDEARNAQCAWEMKQKEDFIVPVFNNELRADKPPFHYFCMMLAYQVLGKSAFAARFFSALCGVLTLLLVYLFTRKRAGEKIALHATCLLGLSVHFLFEFRLAVPDPYLIFFQALTLFSLYRFSTSVKLWWLYIATLAAAVSTLIKGPVAVLLPAIIAIVFLTSRKQLKVLFTFHLVGCFILYVLVAAPWFLLVNKATNGEFTRKFFLEHNLGRFGTTMEGHQNFPGLPLLLILVGLLPASSLFFKKWKIYKDLWQEDLFRFSAITCMVVILFYSFSATILPNYPMICYPFAAVVLAFLLDKTSHNNKLPLILAGLYTLLLAGGALILSMTKELSAGSAYYSIIFAVPVLCCLLSYVLMKRTPQLSRLAFFCGFVLFNSLALGYVYPAIYQQNPISKNLYRVNHETKFGAFSTYNSAINFYIDSPVTRCADATAVASFMRNNKDAVLIGRESEVGKLNGLPLKMIVKGKDLFETPTTVMFVYADSLFHAVSKD